MHNKHSEIMTMNQAGNLEGLAPEQYGSRKSKSADIQVLNTRLFYDLIRQKRIPETCIFIDLVSNYDLIVHSIESLSIPRVDVPKELIFCSFKTFQIRITQ